MPQPAHGQVGINIWVTDMANRAPRALKNDETIDLGGKTVRWLDTPHVPHNWDAGLIYEETTGTLFSSDLFTQIGTVRGDDDQATSSMPRSPPRRRSRTCRARRRPSRPCAGWRRSRPRRSP